MTQEQTGHPVDPPAPEGTSRAYKSRRERRTEIVDATIAIIAEQGLAAWKTAELARRVGVSEPSIFRHFANKEAILTAAVERETAAVRELVTTYRGEGKAYERAEGLVLEILEYFVATGGGPIVIMTGQVVRFSPKIRQDILGTVELVNHALTELYGGAVHEAGDPPGVDPRVLADLAIAIIRSTGLRWIISERTFPFRERAQQMLAIVRRSLARPEGGQPA
ncbi:MAG: TetR/AcrR family transcriptional regulator [Gemmatimonadales bacterium]|nr:TetR/AcrR family transcriptional regulator [Gemmatimonadales bacterium]